VVPPACQQVLRPLVTLGIPRFAAHVLVLEERVSDREQT